MRAFSEEQELFRIAYRKFLEQEVAPRMEEFRAEGKVDRDLFRKAGEHGFLMIWPEEQYGGLGDSDFRYEQVIIEETARADCFEFFNTLHSRLVGPYIQKLGTEAQKEKYLPKAVSGEWILGIAMTEPDAGSDLAGMRSSLKDMGDHYVLNGAKTYISNGIIGDVFVVAAKDESIDNPRAVTLCLVEASWDGFQRGRNLDKMGLKAQDTAELFFDNIKVPKENILGEPGKGLGYLMQGLAEERLIAATQMTARSRIAFNITRNFVLDRKAFGTHVASFQNTQFQMADMDTEIDLIQSYIDQCVHLHNQGKLTANAAAKAKLTASEVEGRMVDLGVQLHGGAGYMNEYQISRMYTDARVARIYGGTSEIMKLIIGRDIFSDSYTSIFD